MRVELVLGDVGKESTSIFGCANSAPIVGVETLSLATLRVVPLPLSPRDGSDISMNLSVLVPLLVPNAKH